jgi:1,4-dihydroxy-2-naphthoate octaprenyltransferase
MVGIFIFSLQILANLANDYGDSIHGADAAGRIGPQRAVQSGAVTPSQMRVAMAILALLSGFSGLGLVFVGTRGLSLTVPLAFLGLGLAALAAAVWYTAGPKPYGYIGLGDVFVFLFFGLIGVIGTYFLHTRQVHSFLLFPAGAVGLLSVGVLNINNMRDIESDSRSGKRTVAVRLGFQRARVYHVILMATVTVLALIYPFITRRYPAVLMVPVLLVILKQALEIARLENPEELDPYLKKLSLSTLLFAFLFGLGVNL